MSESNGDSLGTSVQNSSSSKREVKLTLEWLKDRSIVEIPFAAVVSPCNVTSGTPASFGTISIGAFGRDAKGLEHSFLAYQRAANNAQKDS